jgi:hypothetical protein
LLRASCQCRDQTRAFDDEIRPRKRDLCRPSIGKQFEPPDFVHNTFGSGGAELAPELVGYD